MKSHFTKQQPPGFIYNAYEDIREKIKWLKSRVGQLLHNGIRIVQKKSLGVTLPYTQFFTGTRRLNDFSVMVQNSFFRYPGRLAFHLWFCFHWYRPIGRDGRHVKLLGYWARTMGFPSMRISFMLGRM